MRRTLALFVIVGLAGVLVPVLAVLAQSTSTTSAPDCSAPATCTASKPSTASSTDGKIIDELIAILKETKSEETFIVTALALSSMGPEAKRALPQLIRNAERLELFDDLFGPADSKGDREVAQQVAEAIVMLAAGQPMGYLSTTSSVPCANGSYDTPSAASSWIEPAVVPTAVPPCPAAAAPCPVMSSPVVPPPVLTPGNVSTSGAPVPTPLPAVKNASPKSRKSRAPATPPPPPAR